MVITIQGIQRICPDASGEQHNKSEVDSTKNRTPLKLIYFEACINSDDATRREKYLKTHYGKMFIKKRLATWFSQS